MRTIGHPGAICLNSQSRNATISTTALLQPLNSISVAARAASLAVIGVILLVTLLIQFQASPNFAIAWLIDLLLLGVLVVRIADREAT
ncbi:hypothetical protein [Serratia silvae]|uniref:Uncharacterized protein n=1 Tax=Serratia silvae TaxID=2824122 RepID=A0ABT0K831_9GAMM|nr:hypothetical protein [Serratia silvae]MCL1028203.1 hypothetical protein [Serratia silvae]